MIGCGLVFRSIGYRGRPLGDVPFDAARGLIRNDGGRVCDEEGVPHRGEYAVGWIKRGPSGVIGTNKKDAADTVAKIVADAEAGVLEAPRPDADECAQWLAACAPDAVTWEGWQAIDEHERAAGEATAPARQARRLADLVAAGRAAGVQRAGRRDDRRPACGRPMNGSGSTGWGGRTVSVTVNPRRGVGLGGHCARSRASRTGLATDWRSLADASSPIGM